MCMFIPLCTPILIRLPSFSISPKAIQSHPSLRPHSTEGKTVTGRSTAGPAALPAKAETLRSCRVLGDPTGSHPWRSVDSFFCMLYTYHMYY